MTDWMWMTKDGIDEPARVTRDSFRLCHEPHGWVEYTPPEPVAPVDVQPPADEHTESKEDSKPTTPRRTPAAKE